MCGSSCTVCGQSSNESFRMYFDGYLKLFRCLKCGFVFQVNGPGESSIVETYEQYYSTNFLEQGKEFMYPERRSTLQDIIDRISIVRPVGRILDVGCGDGHFLHLGREAGFEISGVEESIELSAYSSAKTGAYVAQGQYGKGMFPKNSFDVITLIQVLEHIPSPLSALEVAMYHLAPGGLLVIEVPSIWSPHFLAYRSTGSKWFVQEGRGVIPSHVGYYNPRSLVAAARNAGFKELSLTTGRWQYKYSGFLRAMGMVLDPIFNRLRIGGILYMGTSPD